MSELQRILIGDTTWLVILEIVFRTVTMYVFTLLMLRSLGERGIAQLSPFELTIIIALGSSVGDPTFQLDIPLIHGFAVITMIILLQRGIIFISNRHKKLEHWMEGVPTCIAKAGHLDLEGMKVASLSADEVFMHLRLEGIDQLGQVRYAIVEPNGKVSVFKFDPEEVRLGLPIVPPWAVKPPRLIDSGASMSENAEHYACATCGQLLHFVSNSPRVLPKCSSCHGNKWAFASRSKVIQRQE